MNIEREIGSAMFDAIEQTYFRELIKNTPKATGNTSTGWKIKLLSDGTISITNKKWGDIVTYLEEGTGIYGPKKQAYVIKPKKSGGTLAFNIGGKKIFAKFVIHPGIKARHFVRDTFNNSSTYDKMLNILDKRIVNILDKLLTL